MTYSRTLASHLAFALAVVLVAGCDQEAPPAFTYYDDQIAPALDVGCVSQTTGCHVATPEQTAVGNLDLSSYDALMRREDTLPAFGPYTVGQLLLKGGDPIELAVQTFDPPDPSEPDQRFVALTTDVRHAGGALLQVGSDGYSKIKNWIVQGYAREGQVRVFPRENEGKCRSGVGSHPGFDPAADPADAEGYKNFTTVVEPMLVERCAGSTCHGSKVADLYLSCGKTEEEQRWNYFVTLAHLDRSVSLSELLRRPLAVLRGGTFHEGGDIFPSTDDPDYELLRGWIEDLLSRAPEQVGYAPDDEGLRFFGNYVQPMLVKKGCMFANCHSPSMFHDLRLRGGSQGVFSRIAFDKNYEMSKRLLAVESADPNDSRLIAKNLFPSSAGGRGLVHRGGALLEDFDGFATADQCTAVDLASSDLNDVPAYCVLVQWHALERELAIARGEVMPGPDYGLVWVSRPLDVGDARDFDSYRPGADLMRGALTLAADGQPTVGPGVSLLDGCGLSAASADIRGTAVSWDGSKLAFAVRSSAADPFRIYEANADGSACARRNELDAGATTDNGILIHDFDPAYAPDGRLVFASTRGNVGGAGFSYAGPQRTPSQLAPNANLYVAESGKVRQLTFLLNQELQPSFMRDGRLIFTAEKRAPGFFQLATRRQNLDGGDYHPLFAQRASVGFQLATEVVELLDGNFALVAAPFGARDGAGTIAIVNRSIGPDQDDRPAGDLFYLHSLEFPVPGAFDGGRGAYRSPTALPSGWLVASCDPDAMDLAAGGFDFDLCGIDPRTGRVVQLVGEAGRSELHAVAVFARANHGVFRSRIDEANAHTRVDSGANDAIVHISDVPLLATLLFANTREGRPIDPRLGGLDVLESFPPDVDALSFDDLDADRVISDDFGRVFVDYQQLGHVALYDDGSAKIRYPGGHPIVLRATDGAGNVLTFPDDAAFSGTVTQREEMQFYPGERSNQGFRRELFNGMCGGCHGSITGYELDIAVDIDVLTSASKTVAKSKDPTNLGL